MPLAPVTEEDRPTQFTGRYRYIMSNIKYKCTCCDGEAETTLMVHTNSNWGMECDCGELMLPVEEEDRQTMNTVESSFSLKPILNEG